MAKIVLTRAAVDLREMGRTFAVVAPGYPEPKCSAIVSIEELLNERERWLGGTFDTMVIVGLSRIMTPGNRVRLGQVLLRPRPGLTRISVDELLFVSDPWRMWWHFYAVGEERWGYTDSFLAESRWKRALELREQDPFGRERVLSAMRGIVAVLEPFRFPSIAIETVSLSRSIHDAYAELKSSLFEHEKTVHAIIAKLARFAQEHAPTRSVPSAAQLFRRVPEKIVRTDLMVDEFLVKQLLDRIELTNAIADGCIVA